MTLREPQRIRINGVTYRVEVEVIERTEIIRRTNVRYPDPSLKVARKINVKPTPDGTELTIEELGEYIDDNGPRFERGMKEDWLGRHLLSPIDITSLVIHALSVDGSRKQLEDLR